MDVYQFELLKLKTIEMISALVVVEASLVYGNLLAYVSNQSSNCKPRNSIL